MTLWQAIGITAIGVPLYDWAMATRVSAYITSFDYQYWPLSSLRVVSVILLAVGVFASVLIMQPPDDRLWPLALFFPPQVFHGVVVCMDLFRQRREVRSGKREPFPDQLS
jgi:hypothetical protein